MASSLDDDVRAAYRASFAADVVDGHRMPFVVPYSLLGPFIVPTLWLTLSQKRHPWIYHTRWLVAAFVVIFNVHMSRGTSSGNLAMSYATGMLGGWGIIYNLNLLIWTNPQSTAARIVRMRRKSAERDMEATQAKQEPGLDGNVSLRQRRENQSVTGPSTGSVGARTDESKFEYIWEPFPHDAPWARRLNWAVDLTTSFRGCGWNWAISSIPQPKPPTTLHDVSPVDMASMPVRSSTGYTRCTNRSVFLRKRSLTVAAMYLIIDFLAITMAQDPYFVMGPDRPHWTPTHLAFLPPFLLGWLRQLMSLTAFLAALEGLLTANVLLQYFLTPYILPTRDELWHYPSIFGSFDAVLDRGLAGWWGAWWHQTFRAQFLAPATYLLREGYTSKGEALSSILALVITFGNSGLLHAFGSRTSIPDTKLWRSPLFFELQVVGIALQFGLAHLINSQLDDKATQTPRWRILRRFANFAFTLWWVQWTSVYFCDDIASTGLWLCDPVPISPLRILGLGREGDRWWRWQREAFPGWHTGNHWWESGISF